MNSHKNLEKIALFKQRMIFLFVMLFLNYVIFDAKNEIEKKSKNITR